MLERLNKGEALSVDYFKSILAATHVEGIFTNTLYSNIYDLKKGIIYLYYRHQFDEVAVLKVNEELAKGKIRVSLKDLFSHETVGKASKAYKEYIFLMCFGLIVGIGIIIAFIVYFKKYKRNVAAGRNVYNS
jgi:hypothetical protein